MDSCRKENSLSLLIWSRFYESSQTMPTYRSYFDRRFNDTYVGFMKRRDYHVTVRTSAELTQFDGRARDDDVMGNFILECILVYTSS